MAIAYSMSSALLARLLWPPEPPAVIEKVARGCTELALVAFTFFSNESRYIT